jgi:N-hydroxyarylamine O-acetyltransferase
MFTTGPFDLDAYCARIAYSGVRTPDLRTLRALAAHHPAAIAFENLDPLSGRRVQLDIGTLQQKLVVQRRGGYCFEHNLLLGHALAAIGFTVTGLAGRALWGRPAGLVTPRSHMALRVDLEGATWIVDAGFGGLTLTAPVRLEPGLEQTTPHEPVRIVQEEETLVLEVRMREGWRPLYRFDLQPQAAIDYEVANWFVSTNPRSPFVMGLMAARPLADRRYALRDADLAVHLRDGRTLRTRLTSAAALRDALETHFGIAVPDDPDVEAALARLATPGG